MLEISLAVGFCSDPFPGLGLEVTDVGDLVVQDLPGTWESRSGVHVCIVLVIPVVRGKCVSEDP